MDAGEVEGNAEHVQAGQRWLCMGQCVPMTMGPADCDRCMLVQVATCWERECPCFVRVVSTDSPLLRCLPCIGAGLPWSEGSLQTAT